MCRETVGVRRRRTVVVVVVAVLLALAGTAAAVGNGSPGTVSRQVLTVPGTPEPGGPPVSLDATLFLPSTTPAPAVLLAHGFGGSKDDEVADATALARAGFVALTYTARGFGRSGGLIHLDAPGFEIADGSRLIDMLAKRPEVRLDAAGDPRVGVAGGSYGGGLSLLLAGYDQRVDAIAPAITWNDLGQALFPQQAVTAASPAASPAGVTPIATDGVFKRGWAGVLFGSAGEGSSAQGGSAQGSPAQGCGRFAPDVCAAYQATAATGIPTPQILALLASSSPKSVLDRIHAPTLLMQGEADSLFPLSEADANARGIAAAGTPVKSVWFAGGHDGGDQETARLRTLTTDWFDHYLNGAAKGDTRFEVTVPRARVSSNDSGAAPQVRTAPALPGVGRAGPVRTVTLPLSGGGQTARAPAGGSPAALTSFPGAGAVVGTALSALGGNGFSELPGQAASFQTAPLGQPLQVVGSPEVEVTVSSDAPDATLFGKLYDVAPGGKQTLPEQLVAPIRLTGIPAAGQTVRVALPAVVLDVPAGHSLRLSLSTTDSSYALPTDARSYRIGLAAGSSLVLPLVATVNTGGSPTAPLWWAAAGLLAVVLVGSAVVAVLTRRGRRGEHRPDLDGVPLAITGLGKAYQGGFRAVSDLSFRVQSGQVLGLLGPNGAGKTTALRMIVGLIAPTEGEIDLFGHRVRPGAPVLSRVGAFIEGPGFLPHLSGRDNLELYWRATGRPLADAQLGTALEVAGLGTDLDRRVKTYSQGMRQRLAIAQAMLGLPELLVLDEPTNGLDPPQIREMREVLALYAASGRTVVVSSHLLDEVEQTCSHVVVMHRGRLVAQGPVAEIIGVTTAVVVDVDDPAAAAEVATGLPGATEVQTTATGVTLRLIGATRADLVRALVAAGVSVDRVMPQRGLEEAFLALVGEA